MHNGLILKETGREALWPDETVKAEVTLSDKKQLLSAKITSSAILIIITGAVLL